MSLDYLDLNTTGEILSWITEVKDLCQLSRVCKKFRKLFYNNITIITSKQLIILPSSWLCRYQRLKHVHVPVRVTSSQEFLILAKLETCYFDLKNADLELASLFSKNYNKNGTFTFGRFENNDFNEIIYLTPDLINVLIDANQELHDLLLLFPRKQVIAREVCELPPQIEEFTYIPGGADCRKYWYHALSCRKVTIKPEKDASQNSYINYLIISASFFAFISDQEYPVIELDAPFVFDRFIEVRHLFPYLKKIGFNTCHSTSITIIKEYLEKNYETFPQEIKLYLLSNEQKKEIEMWKIGNLNITTDFLAYL